MKPVVSHSFAIIRGIALMSSLILTGCYEDEEETLPRASEPAPAERPAPGETKWLEVTSNEEPASFVARLSGADTGQIDQRLVRAEAHYRESRRMIANRIVQLWDEIGQREGDAIDILELMDQLIATDATSERSIGSVIQNYRILRIEGADHQAAIATAIRRTP